MLASTSAVHVQGGNFRVQPTMTALLAVRVLPEDGPLRPPVRVPFVALGGLALPPVPLPAATAMLVLQVKLFS